MFIIFNKDGSIFSQTQSDFVMQGSNRVNKVFVGFVDNEYLNWTCNGVFNLPNGTRFTIPGIPTQEGFEYLGVKYYGWVIELTAEVTMYAGTMTLTVQTVNQQANVLYTYLTNIIVNQTGLPLDGFWDSSITVAQFNDYMAQLAVKLQANTVSVVVSENELPNIGVKNVLYFVVGEASDTPYQVKMWNGSEYTLLGTINLSSFASKEEQLQFETEINEQIEQIRGEVINPFVVVDTISQLPSSNQNKLYIVKENNSWYYWDGTAYVLGGNFLETGLTNEEITDYTTLNQTFYQYVLTRYTNGDHRPFFMNIESVANWVGSQEQVLPEGKAFGWYDATSGDIIVITTSGVSAIDNTYETRPIVNYNSLAERVIYDNTTSNLQATNVQEAIDELSHKSVGERVRINFPSFYENENIPSVYLEGGKAICDIPYNEYIYATKVYVDKDSGNDITGNGSKSLPYKTIKKAIANITADTTVYVKSSTPFQRYEHFTGGNLGTSYKLSFVNNNPDKKTILLTTGTTGLVWTQVDNVWSATRSLTGEVLVKDESEYLFGWRKLTPTSNLETCKSTVGSYFIAGSTVYVNTLDGTMPTDDKYMTIIGSGECIFYLDNNNTISFNGFGFISTDGDGAVTFMTTTNELKGKVCLFNCIAGLNNKAVGGTSQGNGFNFLRIKESFLFNCYAKDTRRDGFNYHYTNTTPTPDTIVFEFDCKAQNCGLNDDTINNNGSTCHDAGNIIRINTKCINTKGPIIADVGGCKSYLFGCVAENPNTLYSGIVLSLVNIGQAYVINTTTNNGLQVDGGVVKISGYNGSIISGTEIEGYKGIESFAKEIVYDNSYSGLTSKNIQGAIDELNDKIGSGVSAIDNTYEYEYLGESSILIPTEEIITNICYINNQTLYLRLKGTLSDVGISNVYEICRLPNSATQYFNQTTGTNIAGLISNQALSNYIHYGGHPGYSLYVDRTSAGIVIKAWVETEATGYALDLVAEIPLAEIQ